MHMVRGMSQEDIQGLLLSNNAVIKEQRVPRE